MSLEVSDVPANLAAGVKDRVSVRCQSRDGRRVLRNLERQLAQSTDGEGVFTASERAILDLLADLYTRLADLQERYDTADDDAQRLRLSAEMRQLAMSISRLLKEVSTDAPPPLEPPSPRTVKARRAVQARWKQQ